MSLPFISGRGNRGGSFAAGPAAPVATSAEVTRQSDLDHWWKLGSVSAEIGADFTISGDGVLFPGDGGHNGEKAFATSSGSVQLDGSDDYLYAESIAGWELASPYTMTFWARVPSAGSLLGMFTVMDGTSKAYADLNGFLNHGYFRSYQDSTDVLTGLVAVVVDTWFFFTQSYDGSVVKRYKAQKGTDDDPIAILSNASVDYTDPVDSGHNSVYVGEATWGSMAGNVDDARIYGAALPLDDLKLIYNGGDGDY